MPALQPWSVTTITSACDPSYLQKLPAPGSAVEGQDLQTEFDGVLLEECVLLSTGLDEKV